MLRKLFKYLLGRVILSSIIFFHIPAVFAASVVLSWDAPTTNADETPLTDLAGYKVHYGTAPGSYTESINVGNVLAYQVNNLSEGVTYYFAATALDTSGNESEYSIEVSRTIPSLAQVDYYCDSDNDGYVDVSIDGSCTGAGCEPAGCQTTPGNDCNDSNPAIHQNAADDTCNGIDENCDGTPDNNYVMSTVTCGTGVCTSTGQIVCQSGSEINTCLPVSPPENPETTCNDGLDNDCDGQVDEGCFPDITVSNVLLSEDFSSGIPDTWSAHGGWSTENSCGKTIGYPFVGSFAIVDSSCTTTGVDELVTEPLDASSCSSVELVYSNQYYWYSGNIEIDVSSDGGTTWSNNISIGADDGYPTPVWKAIDISSLADAADGQIKFRYANSSFDGFWALDNVWVTCQSNQVDFSTQSQTSSEIIMITNTGKVDLAINNIDVTGQDAVEFNIGGSDNCSGQTLMANETCTFDVLFAPVSKGLKNAIFSISSNDPVTPTSYVSLTGNGTDIVNPAPEIKVNGSSDPVVLSSGDNVSVAIELDPGSDNGKEGDWWVLMEYRKRWYYYDESPGKWRRSHSFYKQGQLDSTGPIKIPESSKLQRGLYTFH